MTAPIAAYISVSVASFGVFLVQEAQNIQNPIPGVSGVIDNPNFWLLVAFYAVFNAAVSSMPAPDSDPRLAGLFYRWAYTFLHAVSMNFMQAFGGKK